MKKSNVPKKVSKAWHMPNVLKKIDIFGEPLQAFNLKGETVITTLTGGISTFIILIIFIAYGSLKAIHLKEKKNPDILSLTEKGVFDSSHVLNLDDMGFKFAWTIENYLDNQRRDDPAYVKYLVRYYSSKDGVESNRLLTYHRCNETDWIDFAPP